MILVGTDKGRTADDKHHDALRTELSQRVRRTQRHRLLHGYPMAPLLRPLAGPTPPQGRLALDPSRPLIVAVLPHTFCNPTVRGCGFCTFAHEKYSNAAARNVVGHVAAEIRGTAEAFPEARDRRVDAVYFGGGTANLTPPECLRDLGAALLETFDLSDAEVSLEGVPVYFAIRNEAMLDVLSAMPVRHRRISMGIQTFDPSTLASMGRAAFGTPTEISSVVRAAQARGMTASCDLLYNLPAQTLEGCLADVRRACEMGFDQICVYNLVLEAGMDSEWSRSPSLLAGMSDAERGALHWLAVRRLLLDSGYVQTTLTNFERREIHETPRRFLYEACSFQPARYDALGFGPGAISTFTSRDRRTALKWMNESTSEGYVHARDAGTPVAARGFRYTQEDLKLLHLTRGLALTSLERGAYEDFFGTDLVRDYAHHFRLLEDARLVRVSGGTVSVTPEGMFFADAIAGLLASSRAAELRDTNDSVAHAMG
jgi:oxygen-independent coproporphyrinogen-3 oxidase